MKRTLHRILPAALALLFVGKHAAKNIQVSNTKLTGYAENQTQFHLY